MRSILSFDGCRVPCLEHTGLVLWLQSLDLANWYFCISLLQKHHGRGILAVLVGVWMMQNKKIHLVSYCGRTSLDCRSDAGCLEYLLSQDRWNVISAPSLSFQKVLPLSQNLLLILMVYSWPDLLSSGPVAVLHAHSEWLPSETLGNLEDAHLGYDFPEY